MKNLKPYLRKNNIYDFDSLVYIVLNKLSGYYINNNKTFYFFENGKFHRKDGPAVIYTDVKYRNGVGPYRYYYKGKPFLVTGNLERDFKNFLRQKKLVMFQ